VIPPASISVPATNSSGDYTVSWGASPTAGATYRLEEATDSSFTTGLRTVVSGTTSLSAAITGRTTGITYYYRVRAEADGLNSSWRRGANGCVVDLSQPLGVWTYRYTPTANPHAYFAYDELEEAWEIVWDYSGYSYYGYDIAGTDSYGREYHNAGSYRYTRGRTVMEEFDNNGFGWYMYKVCKTPLGVQCSGDGDWSPEQPASLTVPVSSTSGSYTVSWDASPTAGVTYHLEEATDAAFTTGLRTVVSGTTALSEVISGRTVGLTYYYRVRADKDGQSSAWRTGNSCYIGVIPPASISVPATNSSGDYTVSWGASPTAGATYRLEEATDSSFTTGLRTVVSGTTSLSAAITGRATGTTYYYRVRAEADGLNSSWRSGANGCVVDLSQPLGVWTYRYTPTATPHAYFAYDEFEEAWEIVWDYSGYFYYGYDIAGTDSYGREYHNAGGYRYTRGRTLMEQFDNNGWDWNMYKTCKTPLGVQCSGDGD
jgi:hypothetical protein